MQSTHMVSQVGIASFASDLPDSATQAEVLAVVRGYNQNPDVHGILVQLPVSSMIGCNPLFAPSTSVRLSAAEAH